MKTNEDKEKPTDGMIGLLPGKVIILPNKTTSKTTYLVKVEDSSFKKKFTTFVTAKLDKMSYGVDFVGYVVPDLISDKIESEKDAVSLINKQSDKTLYSITYPWSKVISIRNVSYRLKL